MENKKFENGQVIFRQGDYETFMYDILEGKVGIFLNYGEAGEKKLTELEAGQVLGELGMLELLPRSATAVALEDTVLAVVDESTFTAYFEQNSEKLFAMMNQMSDRIRTLTGDYNEVCRTIAYTMESEEDTFGGWLMSRLKHFARIYDEAGGDTMF